MSEIEVSYEALKIMVEEYNSLKSRFMRIRSKCWALYQLDKYDNHGRDETRFYHICDGATEEDLKDYVERSSNLGNANCNTYVIVPVEKDALGQVWNQGTDITKHFYKYTGPCKVLLSEQDLLVKNPNTRRWIEVNKVFGGSGEGWAGAYATVTKPEGWKDYVFTRNSLQIVWKSF